MHNSATLRPKSPSRPMSRSQRRALVVATYTGFAVFLGLLDAGYTNHWPTFIGVPTLAVFAATAAAFIQLVRAPGSLPTAVVAWTEPDLPPDV